MIQPLRKRTTGDEQLDRAMDDVDDALRPLQAVPLNDGVLISAVVLSAAGFRDVHHGLNRTPVGYLVVGATLAVNVFDDQANNPHASKTLKLRSSVDATVSLWVF